MKLDVPFFPNTTDCTHCWQACLKMILKYFLPERDFTYPELDNISQKTPGKWTSPTASLLWLMDNGFEVELYEDFDYKRLSIEGKDYIYEMLGKTVGDAQIAHGDIEKERRIAAEFSKRCTYHRMVPGLDLLKKHIKEGYVVVVNVNSHALYGQKGYSGHYVLVIGFNKRGVIIHDPGLPPKPNHTAPYTYFNAAWSYPTRRQRNFAAIRLKNTISLGEKKEDF